MFTRKRVIQVLGFVFSLNLSVHSQASEINTSRQLHTIGELAWNHLLFNAFFINSRKSTALTVYEPSESERLRKLKEIENQELFEQAVLWYYFSTRFPQHYGLQLQDATNSNPNEISLTYDQGICPANMTSNQSVDASSAQLMCMGEDSKLADLVVSYFAEGEFKGFQKGNKSLPIKKIVRRGARLYGKLGDLVSHSALVPTIVVVAAGVLEKTMDYLQSSSDADGAERTLQEAIEEFERICKKDSTEGMSDACEIVLRKIGELKSSAKEEKGKVAFVGIKTVNDFMRLGTQLAPETLGFLSGASFLTYPVISTILVDRFAKKSFTTCSPVVEALLKSVSQSDRNTQEYSEIEKLLLESVSANKPSLHSDSLSCGLALGKLLTLVYGQLSSPIFFNLLTNHALTSTVAEITNGGINLVLDLIPKQSHETEIQILVDALVETYEFDDGSTDVSISPRIQSAVELLSQAPSYQIETMGQIRASIAKRLVILEPRVFSYIILTRLVDEKEGSNTEKFLRNLGVSQNEIRDWTILAREYGADFKFLNDWLLEALRLL